MIIFMGVAGAGKSVQGELLSKTLDCPWVGMGNLLRQSSDTELQKRLLRGELVDSKYTIEVLHREFARFNAANNEFVLDGFPRKPDEAEWLIDKIQHGELQLTAIIHLEASKKLAKERLLKRGRPDDIEPAITERFTEYDATIKPIIDTFQSKGYVVHNIDGELPIDQVHDAVMKVVADAP